LTRFDGRKKGWHMSLLQHKGRCSRGLDCGAFIKKVAASVAAAAAKAGHGASRLKTFRGRMKRSKCCRHLKDLV
jgi:hypothetical protein